MKTLSLTLASASSEKSVSNTSSGGVNSLEDLFTNPIFYVVIGILIILIIAIYLMRRFIKAKPNATTVIVRRGKVYRLLNKDNQKYFLVPFLDSVGAIISDDEKTFSSDKLFINNGPDCLYRIGYTLKYKVTEPGQFYMYFDKLGNLLPIKLNDELRLYADQGNALLLVKNYRENTDKILEVINKAVGEYHIEVVEFKINIIEPMGRK